MTVSVAALLNHKLMTDLDKLILILRLGTGISQKAAERVTSLYADVFKNIDVTESFALNKTRVNTLIADFNLEDELIEGMLTVSKATISAHTQLTPIKPTKKIVKDAFKIIMPDSNKSINDLIKRTKGVNTTSIHNLTLRALDEGWTQKRLKDELTISSTAIKRNVEMIARTSVNAVSNHTKTILYAKNDIVDRVLFSATLDGRTTDVCMNLDGKVFKKEDSPVLPLHPNERSHLLPILKGEDPEQVVKDLLPRPAVEIKSVEELEAKGFRTRTGKIRKPSRTDRSPLKGTQTTAPNYEAWLKEQPKAYQEVIIGKKGTEKFRDGVSLKDVINTSPITEELLSKAIN